VARRRMTIKHLDPFSVLKFGAIAHAALLAVGLVVAVVVWVLINRLGLIDRSCDIASDVGFADCGLSAGTYFTTTILLGVLWAIVQTAVLVFLAFLHNLIADLTGGVIIGIVVDGGPDGAAGRTVQVPGQAPGIAPTAPRREPPRAPAPDPSATQRYDPRLLDPRDPASRPTPFDRD
jgi:hypothetical protein